MLSDAISLIFMVGSSFFDMFTRIFVGRLFMLLQSGDKVSRAGNTDEQNSVSAAVQTFDMRSLIAFDLQRTARQRKVC